MTKIITTLAVITLTLLIVSCASVKEEESKELTLENTKWELVELNGRILNHWQYQNVVPNITFEQATGKFTGFDGCNSMFGSYLKEDGSFGVGVVSSTKKACGEDNIENEFMAMIRGAVWTEIKNEMLYVHNQNDEVTAVFKPGE